MRAFSIFCFWFFGLYAALSILMIALTQYPRSVKETYTVGHDAAYGILAFILAVILYHVIWL